jgi:hypothetical protein
MFEPLKHVTALNFLFMLKIRAHHFLTTIVLTDRSAYSYFIVVKYVGPGAGYMRHNICFRNCFSLFLQQLVRLNDNLG